MTARTGVRRLTRIGLLGGSSLLLGVGAHLAGGGMLPRPGVLMVLGALLGMIAVSATHRRLRFGVLVAVLGLEQLGLHAVLALAGHGPTVSGGSHLGHTVTVGTLPSGDPMTTTPAMVLAHLAATVLTAWLLAHGERWFWRVADQLTAAFGAKLRRPRTAPRPAFSLPGAPVLRHRYGLALRRGPPVVLAVF